MIKHYLMLSLRNLMKYKTQSAIKILGLALGLTASIVIMLVNHSELTRDTFWEGGELIYALELRGFRDNPDSVSSHVPQEFKYEFKDYYPQISATARIFSNMSQVTTEAVAGEPVTFNDTVSEIDAEFLEIFSFDLLHGSFDEFSKNYNGVIISQKQALKHFGESNVVGQKMTIDTQGFLNGDEFVKRNERQRDYIVLAVITDIPYKTDIHYGTMIRYFDISDTTAEELSGKRKGIRFNARTFLKLESIGQLTDIEAQLPEFIDKAYPTIMRSSDELPSSFTQARLINVEQARLYNQGTQTPRERMWMLYFLAAIILAAAAINTINLTLAAYAQRQQEVALRKTLGARRRAIFLQFWLEALVGITLAFTLSLMLLEYLVPWLTATLHIESARHFLYMGDFFGQLILLVILLSVVIGLYPGIYLSSIKPALILHTSRAYETLGSIRLRKFLVIVQFLLSSALVIAAGLVSLQLNKVMSYNPGYQTKNILFGYHQAFARIDHGQFSYLKQQVLGLAGVKAVSATMPGIPGHNSSIAPSSRVDQARADARPIQWSILADSNQLSLLNIPLIAGRLMMVDDGPAGSHDQPGNDVITERPSEPEEIIVNEQAVAYLGFDSPDAAIGQLIKRYFSDDQEVFQQYKIVGVTGWLHFEEYEKTAEPMALWMPNMKRMMVSLGVRFEGVEREVLEKQINELWDEVLGVKPNSWLLEDTLNSQYQNQRITAKFIYFFSALAIVISTLGLYGFAALSAHKRTREIALRKLHGASAIAIIKLLARDFSVQILVANLLALPLALYAMNYWLESFQQRIHLLAWGLILSFGALMLSLVIAWLTLTAQAWRVIRSQPAQILREA